MPAITSIRGRVLYNSRGDKTIEVDVESAGRFRGRVCAPSGASVGKHEAASFPPGGPEQSVRVLRENAARFAGVDSGDMAAVHNIVRCIDDTPDYAVIGGATAFAVTIAAAESAALAAGKPLFSTLSDITKYRFPVPLGNILGGGAHAGPGTPDIQEILVCAPGADTIRGAIDTNLAVHRELRNIIQADDPLFTNGRGDEGGWAPRLDNEKALELAARACESLGFTLGKEVSLGVDYAASTQWNEERGAYLYDRAGFENSPGEQVDYTSEMIKKFKLAYVEDAVHEEAFGAMAELVSRFPDVLITGDDLTVTNHTILRRAIREGSCNAAILKVNQAGSLFDAMEFAAEAGRHGIGLVTSHRSGESADGHIAHIGIATGSKMLKAGIVGGERVAKLNEMIRLLEHDLIYGMAEI